MNGRAIALGHPLLPRNRLTLTILHELGDVKKRDSASGAPGTVSSAAARLVSACIGGGQVPPQEALS